MTLCGFEIAPGEKRQVKLPVPGGEPLEAWLLCGTHPGKKLVVTAGVHGWGFGGHLALQKLVETSQSRHVDLQQIQKVNCLVKKNLFHIFATLASQPFQKLTDHATRGCPMGNPCKRSHFKLTRLGR